MLGDVAACDVPRMSLPRLRNKASLLPLSLPECPRAMFQKVSLSRLRKSVFRDHTDFTVMVDYEAEHSSCRPHARASHLLADGISASLSNAERVSLSFHKFGVLPTHSFYVTWRAVSCTRERWCRMWSTFRWPCAFCFAATRCHLKVHHVCDTSALVSPALAVSHAAPALGWEYIPPATAVCAPPAPDVECFSGYSNL